jgi:phosphate uptake regulator
MKRRVIQIADSTQLVSLPRKWALKYGIKKGDEIDIEEKGDKLVLTSSKGSELSSVEIDLTGANRTSIIFYVEVLYRIGYDEIKVKFSNPLADHYRLNKKEKVISVLHYIESRLVGMEIIQERDNVVVLKSLEHVSADAFNTVINRIFILLQNAADDFIEGVKKGDYVSLEAIEEKHDSIAKFVNYGMRILNKKGPGDERNIPLLYHILNQLDKVMDIIKYSSRDIIQSKKTMSRDSIMILENINKSLKWYAEFFVKFDKNKIKDMYFTRDIVIKEIHAKVGKLRSEEVLIVEYYRHILEFLSDVTQARIGLEY